MPNGLRIEHLGDIISKAQRWLVLNLPVFKFFFLIHFNVPPTRITDLVTNVSDKKFIDMEHSLCLPVCFWFYKLELVCVQSVTQLMNTLFITFALS